jgi:hypothetical protein
MRARSGTRANRRAGISPNSSPAKPILPIFPSISRVTSRTSVDLPHPDSPTNPTVSPRAIAKSTPSTARSHLSVDAAREFFVRL